MRKSLAYAELLREAGRVYADRGQDAFVVGARELAVQVLELAAAKYGEQTIPRVGAAIAELRGR